MPRFDIGSIRCWRSSRSEENCRTLASSGLSRGTGCYYNVLRREQSSKRAELADDTSRDVTSNKSPWKKRFGRLIRGWRTGSGQRSMQMRRDPLRNSLMRRFSREISGRSGLGRSPAASRVLILRFGGTSRVLSSSRARATLLIARS